MSGDGVVLGSWLLEEETKDLVRPEPVTAGAVDDEDDETGPIHAQTQLVSDDITLHVERDMAQPHAEAVWWSPQEDETAHLERPEGATLHVERTPKGDTVQVERPMKNKKKGGDRR